MKKSFIYFSALALCVAGTVMMTSCDDNWEYPPMVVPEATIEANTTIAELKNEFQQAGTYNYSTTVGVKADGQHYIIEGYVTSSDESGNIFKKVYIEDETGGIYIGIDAYDLYESYKVGQKIVVDVTGLAIGGYGGAMNIGTLNETGAPNRIAEDVASACIQVDGLPSQENMVQPMEMSMETLSAISPLTAAGIAYQNRLVRISGVTFQKAGKETLSTSGSSGVSQTFSNSEGSAILYTSGYSDFWDYYCPTGTGDIVGILSSYGANWQMVLIDITGLQGFDELVKEPSTGGGGSGGEAGDTEGNGTEDNPYNVAAVIAGASGTGVWVKGYIVGWVDGMTLSSGATFNANNVTVQSNILIADTPTASDVAQVVPVQLPSGAVRSALNLATNPANLGKEVMVYGELAAYFGTNGVKTVTDYKLDGAGGGNSGDDTPAAPVASISQDFEGGAIPAGWTQVQVAGNKTWYVTSYSGNYYAAMTGYQGTAPFDQWLVTPAVNMDEATTKVFSFTTEVNGYGSKTSALEVYVMTTPDPSTATLTKLNPTLATAPASGYSDWVSSGNIDLSAYSGVIYIGFRYTATQDANYATWCIDNVKVNVN